MRLLNQKTFKVVLREIWGVVNVYFEIWGSSLKSYHWGNEKKGKLIAIFLILK